MKTELFVAGCSISEKVPPVSYADVVPPPSCCLWSVKAFHILCQNFCSCLTSFLFSECTRRQKDIFKSSFMTDTKQSKYGLLIYFSLLSLLTSCCPNSVTLCLLICMKTIHFKWYHHLRALMVISHVYNIQSK